MFKHYHLHDNCRMCKKEEGSCGASLWFYTGVIYKECYSSLNTCIMDKDIVFVLPLSSRKITFNCKQTGEYRREEQRRFSITKSEKETSSSGPFGSPETSFSSVEDFFDENGNLIPLGERLEYDVFLPLSEELGE